MSWQALVDSQMIQKGGVTSGAIIGQQGGVWASSPNFNLSPAEQQTAVNAFTNPDAALAGGMTLAGVKYITLGTITIKIQEKDVTIVYGKRQADGYVLAKTNQAVVVAVYVAPINSQQCIGTVADFAGYLHQQGF